MLNILTKKLYGFSDGMSYSASQKTMLSKYRLLHSSRSLTCSCFRDRGMLPIITEGEARGDCRYILKVHILKVLKCNNRLRLWVISSSFSV